jgi:cell division protease FtsH
MSFGKSKAKLLGEDQITTTFADVAGVEEAKEDVQELVEFLRDPSGSRSWAVAYPAAF